MNEVFRYESLIPRELQYQEQSPGKSDYRKLEIHLGFRVSQARARELSD